MLVRDRLDLFPLRQMVSVRGEAEHVFARQELLDWLSRPERYQIVSHGNGGQIMAGGEQALCDAETVLRQAYGPLVEFGSPSVHTFVDTASETLMVPIIFMRIDAPRRYADKLHRLLVVRSATIEEVDLQRDRAVLRAELDLTRSLGLEKQVAHTAGGTAHILSWLLRYGRVPAESSAVGDQSQPWLVSDHARR